MSYPQEERLVYTQLASEVWDQVENPSQTFIGRLKHVRSHIFIVSRKTGGKQMNQEHFLKKWNKTAIKV